MAKQTKAELESIKTKLLKELDKIDNKIIELEKPNKIGFVYKNRIV